MEFEAIVAGTGLGTERPKRGLSPQAFCGRWTLKALGEGLRAGGWAAAKMVKYRAREGRR